MSKARAKWPSDWPVQTLENIASHITSGGTPTSGSPRYYVEHGGLPFAKTEDLTRAGSKFVEHCELGISEAALKETAAKKYPAGTILVSMYGTIGLTKIAANEMAANQALCALIPPLACDSNYLYQRLEYIRPEWQKFSGQTTQANINGATVRAHEIPLPPKGEQTKIAQILDTLDSAIHETVAIIAKLKAVKQGLLHDLLTCGIDANGEIRPRHAEAPHLYKESSLGWIPKEWEIKQLTELLAAVDPAMRSGPFGSALLKQELAPAGIPFLGIDNIHTERFVADYKRFVTQKKFTELVRYAVRPHDLMITIMGTVGRCCLVPEDVGPALSSKHTWTISLDRELYSPYLAMLQVNYSPWVLEHFGRDQQGGTMAAIRSDTLRTTLLPTPPREEQHLMEERLRAISKRIDLEVDSCAKMQAAKSGVVDDLLTGRIRVTNILAPLAGTHRIDPHSLLLELCQALYDADQRAKDEYKRELFGDVFIPELLVMRENKVRIEIRKENVSHNAPHLHISHSGEFDASISLKDFSKLAGTIDKKVLKYFVEQLAPVREQLMEIWNELNEKENSIAAEALIKNLKL